MLVEPIRILEIKFTFPTRAATDYHRSVELVETANGYLLQADSQHQQSRLLCDAAYISARGANSIKNDADEPDLMVRPAMYLWAAQLQLLTNTISQASYLAYKGLATCSDKKIGDQLLEIYRRRYV